VREALEPATLEEMSTAPVQPNVQTLLDQGDSYAAKDDVRAAASYYQAALKAAQHQPPSIGRALRHVRSLPAAPVDGAELADDAAQMLVDGLVLRESLLEVCEELEQAMGRVRARLDALGATPGPDELEAAAHAGYNGAGAMEAGLNGHGAGHG